GTASSCYCWYVAVPGDDCSKIDSQYSITFAQLRAWNPYLDSTCSNLWVDYAYCV
ncbi:LysM peptidoglycan-binding domain-containing protein, partial [Aspergillus novofumigatus IBT 16806]